MRKADITSQTSTPQAKHPPEEVLEKYLLGRLDKGESAQVEQHLISCPACVEVARGLEDYVRAMRKALEEKLPKARAARRGK